MSHFEFLQEADTETKTWVQIFCLRGGVTIGKWGNWDRKGKVKPDIADACCSKH